MTTRVAKIKSRGSYPTMSKAVIRTQTIFFRWMDEEKKTDYAVFHNLDQTLTSAMLKGIFSTFETLEYFLLGYKASGLENSIKTSTGGKQDIADIKFNVAALIHDIGNDHASENHFQIAAAILRHHVRGEVIKILKMHGVFSNVLLYR